MGCGYTGNDFGAHYNDSCCIDGYLWDLDSCDEPGGALYNGGDIPCPSCNTKEYITEYCDRRPSGNAKQRRIKLRAQIKAIHRRIAKR